MCSLQSKTFSDIGPKKCNVIVIIIFRNHWCLAMLLITQKNEHCGALRNLVPFVQFKKREKRPWRSVTFS